jgi:N-formylglutamate deformylase
MAASRPLLIVTPHNSGHAPQDVLRQMLGDVATDPRARQHRAAHLFDQGDPYTDVIFQLPGAHHVHATVSRFVVDLNRPRSLGGENGVIKLTDFDAVPLYPPGFRLDEVEREERLRRYWDPFHREIDRVLDEHRVRLLIDGHSMTERGPSIGPDAGRLRPAITLMTGGDEQGEPLDQRPPSVPPHLARELRSAAERHFAPVLIQWGSRAPAEVVLNRPWSTDEISVLHGNARSAGRVPGFGIEINRALYMEPGEPGERALEGRIVALQRCFAAFAEEALTIVEERSLGGEK